MPETSVVVKAEDRYSSAVKKMASTTKAFSKDAEEMEKTLTALSKKRFDLRMDLDKAKKELKDAEKQFQATGDAADRMTAQGKQANFDALQKQLRDVNKEAKQVEKGLGSVGSTARKMGNEGLIKNLTKAGLGKMLGDSVGQVGNALISSAMGEPVARMASGALSGAVTGATLGSIAGPWGAAAGAAAGGISGLFSGWSQSLQAEDDAFKAHYAQSVETAMAARDAELSRGSAIAAGRKTDQISFSNLFGDEETAKGYLSDLVGMANTTPFLYDDLTAMSKTLASFGYGADNILPVLQTIGNAGAALGMGTGDMTAVAAALGRMKSSDKTTMEYLNILNDRGIGAVGMLADAYGVDQGTVYDMISKGKIAGTDAVEIILEALGEAFQGAMKEQSETFSGKTSTLQGLEQEMENAMGAAYNEGALTGIQGDIDAYNGALGDALQGINAMIGEGRAMAENLERQYKREALEALTGTGRTTLYDEDQAERLGRLNTEYEALRKEFDTADEARKAEIGAKMESLKGQAEALAADAYQASETGIALKDTELELIEAIRENTAALGEAAWNHEYNVSLEKSKGTWSVPVKNDPESVAGMVSSISPGPDFSAAYEGSLDHQALMRELGGYAYGLERVPYDNFPALLHEGERVLTASQARAEDRGGGGKVSVQIGQVSFGTSVNDPEDAAERFAAALRRELLLAAPG